MNHVPIIELPIEISSFELHHDHVIVTSPYNLRASSTQVDFNGSLEVLKSEHLVVQVAAIAENDKGIKVGDSVLLHPIVPSNPTAVIRDKSNKEFLLCSIMGLVSSIKTRE